MVLFGKEHVDRYRATDGAEGHDWRGTQTLLLTTRGRKSGEQRTTPLIYQQDGDRYVVSRPRAEPRRTQVGTSTSQKIPGSKFRSGATASRRTRRRQPGKSA